MLVSASQMGILAPFLKPVCIPPLMRFNALCEMRREKTNSPQVPMGKGVAGTNLQVLLQLRGTFTGFEGDAADKFPWLVLVTPKEGEC